MWRTLHGAGALGIGLLVCCAVLGPSARARADAPAIVVVVESAAQRIEPAVIRRALSQRLGVPVVSLFDARARSSRGVLSILVDETGHRASVQFQPRGGRDYSVLVSVDAARTRQTDWLVDAAASVVSESDSWTSLLVVDAEILDPWGGERAYIAAADPMYLPSEVLDPFGDSEPISEVLDPWAHAPERSSRVHGPASRLSRPIPGRALRPAR